MRGNQSLSDSSPGVIIWQPLAGWALAGSSQDWHHCLAKAHSHVYRLLNATYYTSSYCYKY